jgi:hypothetical protein
MTGNTEGSRIDERLAQMEATVRELQGVQKELRDSQWWLRWGGGTATAVLGIVTAVLVAVIIMNLARSFALTDQLADVRIDTGALANTMSFVREDVAEIKSDVKAMRAELRSVAEAVGAQLEQQKTELAPFSPIE